MRPEDLAKGEQLIDGTGREWSVTQVVPYARRIAYIIEDRMKRRDACFEAEVEGVGPQERVKYRRKRR